MKDTFVIWGAGREGRGFLADLFQAHGSVVLVDDDADLVRRLQERERYTLYHHPGVGHPPHTSSIEGWEALHAEAEAVIGRIVDASAVFLCIYIESMADAVVRIVDGLRVRHDVNPEAPLDVFICANSLNYGPILRALFLESLPRELHAWFTEHVGIVETLVRRTCVTPSDEVVAADPLSLVTNAFPRLLIDGQATQGDFTASAYDCFEFSDDMRRDERLKIFTYNLLHAAYAYLGNRKSYTYLAESRDDPAVQSVAAQAYAESRAALTTHYAMTVEAVDAFETTMWRYVVTPALHDRVDRAGFNPIRKLNRTERLVGSALLCMEEGIEPTAIVQVIAAALTYTNDADPYACELNQLVQESGVRAALEVSSGLDPADPRHGQLMDWVMAAI